MDQEQDIKDLLDKQREDITRDVTQNVKGHIDVLKEDFDGQVKLIAEQYNSIREKLDSHTEMIASTQENIEIMKIDISFIKGSLKQKVDVEDFSVLEHRVALLEAKLMKN